MRRNPSLIVTLLALAACTANTVMEPEAAQQQTAADTQPPAKRVAVVSLSDQRLSAHVQSVLCSLAYEVRPGREPAEADVWVTEAENEAGLEAARSFARSRDGLTLPPRRNQATPTRQQALLNAA